MATKKKAGEQPDAPRETAKAAAPPPDKGKRYVEVSVALPPRPLMKHPETEAYWLGSLPGGPLDTYKFGGHAFPRETKVVLEDGKAVGPLEFRPRVGAIVWLMPEQVEDIRQDVARFVIRRGGYMANQGRIINTEDWGERRIRPRNQAEADRAREQGDRPALVNLYRPSHRDYPAGHHVYLLPWLDRGMYVNHAETGFIQRPPSIAEDLELEIPAWVDEELERYRENVAREPDPFNIAVGPSLEQAQAMLNAR